MQLSRFYAFALTVLSLVFGYLVYLVVRPFLAAILWAVVLTIVFYPVFLFLSKYIRWKSVASLLTLLIILLLMVGPFSYMFITLGTELLQFSSHVEQGQLNEFFEKIEARPLVAWFMDILQSTFGIRDLSLAKILQKNLASFGANVVEWVSVSVRNIAFAMVQFVIMCFSLYFLLRDGPGFLETVKGFLPFPDSHRERLASKIKDMVISTIYGGVIVGISQGVVGGTAFYLLDISSPVFWGMAIALMSFVPMIGTFAIWGPAAAILVFQGAVLKGIILFLIGVFVISMIDNILKPLIIGGRTKMHTLVIFFSVLGGINLFGLIGLIMGPLVIVIFLSIFEVFRHIEDEFVVIESGGAKK